MIFMKTEMRRINLGSGMFRKEGYINIDKDLSAKPDIVRDIERGLPFDSDSVDEVRACHILEHVSDFIFVLKEIYRVCKNGATVFIEVPIGISDDPTHKTFFTPTSFDHWIEPLDGKEGRKQDYYGGNIHFRAIERAIVATPQPVLCLTLMVIKSTTPS